MISSRPASRALCAWIAFPMLSSFGLAQSAVTLHGSGTTNPSKFFWKVMESFEAQSLTALHMTYRAVGSSTGQKEFVGEAPDYTALTHFGAGDIPMDQTRYNTMKDAGHHMVHVPFSLGAIGIFHSIPANEVPSAGLKLAPCTLAKIFSGVITTWDDAEIMADNVGLAVPAGTPIQVAHRRYGSSSTGGTTGYLKQKCPADWTLDQGALITWPSTAQFHQVEGSGGMTEKLSTQPYTIGYLDAGHGHQRNLQEVSLKNEDNEWLTSMEAMQNGGVEAAGASGVSRGSIPSDATADWSQVNLYSQAGQHTWPIVLVSYIYVRKDVSSLSADQAGLLYAFVDYVLKADGGQAMLADFSFTKIPSTMNMWYTIWNDDMVKPSTVNQFTFEESTMPYQGQASSVISVKRSSYTLWKVGNLDGRCEALDTRIATLENAPVRRLEEAIVIDGSGTTNPSKFFWKIMESFEARSRTPLRLTYRAVGSGTGQKEFVGQDSNSFQPYTHFASGDIPMSSTHYATLTQKGRQMVHVPFSLGAIGIFHSIPQNQLPAAGLRLSACVLAKIFSGAIRVWDHADIIADNQDLSVPSGTKIQVGHRTLGSSSTGGTSGYLHKKCEASWGLGASSTIAWPQADTFRAVEGSGGMTSFIADTNYAIGYLDAGHGHMQGFHEVELQNEDGQWLTSKKALETTDSDGNNGIAAAGAAAVARNVIPADVTADWSAVNLYSQTGANTWPIVLVSYIYLPKSWASLSAGQAGLLKAFMDYVTSETQGQAMLSEFSFNKIPATMNKWPNTYTNVIEKPATVSGFTFEESTDPLNGQAANVISVKRDSYSLWKVGSLETVVEGLDARVTALESAGGRRLRTPITVDGSGTTNPSKFFWKIMQSFQARTLAPMRFTYRAVGSSTGQKEFMGQTANGFASLTDFAAGDIPMDSARYSSITGAGRKMVHVPFSLGAIAIFHSIPASQVPSGGLKLSPCTLAKIFDGAITEWDDPEIEADNVGLNVPAGTKIQVAHRTQGSSSTGGVTGYLKSKCPSAWTRGEAASITWPDIPTMHAVEGSGGMTAKLVADAYTIGYLDAGHGHDRNLQEVKLKNEADRWLTSMEAMQSVDSNGNNGIAAAGAAAVEAGDIPTDVTADWSSVNLYRKAGAHTWPIVLVSYIYVSKDWCHLSADEAGALKAFVDYVTSPTQGQAMVSQFAFNPIPSAMNKWTQTWNDVIMKPATVTDFTFEESTAPWIGQGANVISVKRNTYTMWKVDDLDKKVDSLETRVALLEGAPAPASSPAIVPGTPSPPGSPAQGTTCPAPTPPPGPPTAQGGSSPTAPPAPDVPPSGNTVTLHGSGTTNPSKFFWHIMESFQVRSRVPMHMTYRAVGSSTGQKEFVGDAADGNTPLNDFGSGDIPMTKERYDELKAASRDMVHVPFALGAIGVFHSIPSAKIPADGIMLSPCTLAKIFMGTITTWDHADIASENPGLSVPQGQTIEVRHRTQGSSSTTGFTGYLHKKCSSVWTKGEAAKHNWPDGANFQNVEGSGGMAAAIKDTPYAIGYLDAGHGHQSGFAEVKLQNEACCGPFTVDNPGTSAMNWLTSLEALRNNGVAEAGTRGVASGDIPADVTADWSDVNLYGQAGASTWPIVLISYIYVNKDISAMTADQAGLLKAFVDYVTSADQGQRLMGQFSFTPVPAALNKWSATWNNVMIKPSSVTTFKFEESTTPYDGQAAGTISVKRNSYTFWKVSDLDAKAQGIDLRLSYLEQRRRQLGEVVVVDGSGTTNPSKFFWKIMEMFQARSRTPLRMTYRAVGSSTGQKEFVGQETNAFKPYTDFGSGDIPLTKERYDQVKAAGRQSVHVPFALGAIGIFHSIPKDKVPANGIRLSACVLAKIFSGQITTWDHADIAADNDVSGIPGGTPIKVAHRTRGSSSTSSTSGYLKSECPGSWSLGESATISWPQTDNFHAVEGSGGMTAALAGTEYAIGYLDAGHGHDKGLQEVKLQNADGTYLTSAESIAANTNGVNGIAAAGAAAVNNNRIPSDVTADWSAVNLYGQAGLFTWPIVLVSYIYLDKDISGLTPDEAGLLKAFVDFVTGPNQGQAMLSEFSFNSIPDEMNTWSQVWNNVIVKPSSVTAFSFEESTEAYIGQGAHVISAKRDSYSMWKVGELDAMIDDMTTRVAALEGRRLVSAITLHGSGTTNPSKYFWQIMEMFQARALVPLQLTYRAVGSSTGQKEFLGRASNSYKAYSSFGAGDIPMDKTRYDQLTASGRKMVHVPFCLGAIGVFHSIPSSRLPAQGLKLSPCVLAKIFAGQITTWDHAEILAINTGLNVPPQTKIRVAHRTRGSSSTGGLSGYLKARCPASWTLGESALISWPNIPTMEAVEGSGGMTDYISDNEYAIGYLDAGHGHSRNFNEVKLQNEAGTWLTSKDAMAATDGNGNDGVAAAGAAAVAANRIPTDATADWSSVNLYGQAGDNTWPIVLVSYIYLDKDQTDLNSAEAGLLKAFVDYVLGPQGQAMLEGFAFSKIPGVMNKWQQTWDNVIGKPARVTKFSFEESTNAWVGQGNCVISVKRDSYMLWKVGDLDAKLDGLETRVTALEGAASGRRLLQHECLETVAGGVPTDPPTPEPATGPPLDNAQDVDHASRLLPALSFVLAAIMAAVGS